MLLHISCVWFTCILFVFDGCNTKAAILRVAAAVVYMITVVLDSEMKSESLSFRFL